MILSGIYDFDSRLNTVSESTCQIFDGADLTVYVLTDSDDDIAQTVAENYSENGACCIQNIPQLFIAVVYDKINKVLHAFCDITTSPFDLYYTVNNNRLYYSTSLKKLLIESNIKRELNIDSANEFLINGFVMGKETLIENVEKIQSGYELTADGKDIGNIKFEYKTPECSAEDPEEELLPEMRKNIESLIEYGSDVYIPLSSGFDSNLVLDTVLSKSSGTVNAFTVGGKVGRSEIDTVKENVADIQQVKLHTVTVDEEYFNNFTDIVWRLDGSVFESGVFLQYALAKAVSNSGAKSLICGEYADQILSVYYENSMKRVLDNKLKKNEKIFMYADPFITGNMIILKKSCKMLDSFGVSGKYPFARNNISPVAKKVRYKNKADKKLYKEKCKKQFRPVIIKNLKKIGGTTSNTAVISEENYELLKKKLDTDKTLNKIKSLCSEAMVTPYSYRLRAKQALTRIISDMKENGVKAGIKEGKAALQNKSMGKELKELYLLIFIELFISGKYDDSFENPDAPISTGDFFSL